MLLPVYDAMEYARSKTVDRAASASRFGETGREYPMKPRSMRNVSTVMSTRFKWGGTAGADRGAAAGVRGSGRSAPEQSSSIPLPGMSTAVGERRGSASSQSPPPNKYDAPSPSRSVARLASASPMR